MTPHATQAHAATAYASQNELEAIARDIIDLGKASVLGQNHFLAGAIGRLNAEPAEVQDPLATDGYHLAFNAALLIEAFRTRRNDLAYDLVHSVAHCLFLHPYANPSLNQAWWNLACDVAAEHMVIRLLGARPGPRGAHIAHTIGRIEHDMGARADAEHVYRFLKEGGWAELAEQWTAMMHVDSHELWHPPGVNDALGNGASGSGAIDVNQPSGGSADAGTLGASGEQSASPEEAPGAQAGSEAGEELGNTIETHRAHADAPRLGQLSRPDSESQMRIWRSVATHLAIQLQTRSARLSQESLDAAEDLQRATRIETDYTDLLAHFATLGEIMRLNDDEFDTVFYTYGIKLYGDMPLIEPLEYREENRVREFVLVIDTSKSVQGEAVRTFVSTAFHLFKHAECFFDDVHVRILQCDVAVQSDDTITTIDELEGWCNSMVMRGGGGTDFRPAFAYINQLVENGEFDDLGGVVYFTDGKGTFPMQAPSYTSAFVLYGPDSAEIDVPTWAYRALFDDKTDGSTWHTTRNAHIA